MSEQNFLTAALSFKPRIRTSRNLFLVAEQSLLQCVAAAAAAAVVGGWRSEGNMELQREKLERKKKEFTILVRVPEKKTFPPCSCHDFFFPVLFENPHRTRKGKKDAKRLNVRESWRTLSHIPDVKKGQKFKLAACLCHKPRVRVPREREGKKTKPECEYIRRSELHIAIQGRIEHV